MSVGACSTQQLCYHFIRIQVLCGKKKASSGVRLLYVVMGSYEWGKEKRYAELALRSFPTKPKCLSNIWRSPHVTACDVSVSFCTVTLRHWPVWAAMNTVWNCSYSRLMRTLRKQALVSRQNTGKNLCCYGCQTRASVPRFAPSG